MLWPVLDEILDLNDSERLINAHFVELEQFQFFWGVVVDQDAQLVKLVERVAFLSFGALIESLNVPSSNGHRGHIVSFLLKINVLDAWQVRK